MDKLKAPESAVFRRATPSGEVSSIVVGSQAASPLPSEEVERTAETISRALPDLRKLDRYEQRSMVRRERSLRAFFYFYNLKMWKGQHFGKNEPNFYVLQQRLA